MKKIKSPFFIDDEEFKLIQNEACEENRKIIKYFFSFSSVLIAVLLGISFVYEPYFKLRLSYGLAFTLSALLLFFVKIAPKHDLKSTLFAVYMSAAIFLSYGMSLAWNSPDDYSVTFICVLLIASMIYIDKPRRFTIFILCYMLAFILMALRVKSASVRTTEIINVSCFGVVSIVINHILVRVKVDNFILAKKLKYMSEMDKLTDLRNRNLYEAKLPDYEKARYQSLACIYVDVDGLHDLNNTQGHEAGDKMLRFIADKFKEFYGAEHTYRIGGDEFVAFVLNQEEDAIKESTDLFRKAIIAENYHVSLGFECCREITNIQELIKKAEQKMYLNKKNYYESKHLDRRNKQ